MPRTYRFDHFTAAKPDVSKQKLQGSDREKQTPLKSEQPAPPDGKFNYGHRHAKTEEMYKKHREEHERAEAQRGEEAQAREEPVVQGKEEPGRAERAPLEPESRERLRGLAQQAVSSVMQAAREAVKGRPLQAGKRLAGEAVTGARKVARQVSARTVKKGGESESEKGRGK